MLLQALRVRRSNITFARPARTETNAAPSPPSQLGRKPTLRLEVVKRIIANGEESERRKLWPQAEQQYLDALQLDPDNVEIHFGLGRVLGEQNKWDEAISEYREVVGLSPNSAPAHYDLGRGLLAAQDPDAAIPEYREALRLQPGSADAHCGLGLAFYRNMTRTPRSLSSGRRSR